MIDNKTSRRKIIDYIVKVAIFSSLSIILYFVKFPLPFLFPSFLEVQFSNLPAYLGGFILGPVGGVLIIVIRTLIKLPFTTTMCIGELADLFIGISAVLPSALIYKYNKTKKAAIISLIIGAICWICCAIFANSTFLIAFYKNYFGLDKIIQACAVVIPWINNDNYMKAYILCAVIPFNLMLSTIVSVITFLIYKNISKIFKKEFIK